jgi:RNA polymerase sigma factor (sigma-70 family)
MSNIYKLVYKSTIDQYFETIFTEEYEPLDNNAIEELLEVAQSGYDKETSTWLTEEAIEARNEVIKRNVRIIPYVLHKIMKDNKSLFMDCINECHFAIIKCVINYNVGNDNNTFATYAQTAISRHAWRFIREQSSSITLPYNKISERKKVENEIYSNSGALDRLFDQDYLPVNPVISLDYCRNNSDDPRFSDIPINDNYPDSKSELELRTLALDSLNCLTDQEKMIIESRYLVDSKNDKMTLRELATEIGKTGERVRQIEEMALEKMRNFITVDNGEER